MSVFEAKVRSLSTEGWGVVPHPEGRIFFVPGAWPGDEGLFEIERFEKRYGFARIKEIRRASPDRVKSPCPHQGYHTGACGGCAWMIGSYTSQLAHKEHRLRFALNRAGLLPEDSPRLKKIWASERELGYRNRAQFKTNGVEIGFVSEKSHHIVPIQKCAVLNEKMSELFSTLRDRLPQKDWEPQAPHHWNFIDIDDAQSPEEISLNQRRPFRQGNAGQNQKMQAWLRAQLGQLNPQSPILELYAGSGNFTRIFSEANFSKITAVEISANALPDLVLKNVKPLAMDLLQNSSWRRLAQECADTEILFLDPPREGSKELAALVENLPKLREIFYVSCDVATFVRDLSPLKKRAELLEIQPLDLFPQTPHLETLAHLHISRRLTAKSGNSVLTKS